MSWFGNLFSRQKPRTPSVEPFLVVPVSKAAGSAESGRKAKTQAFPSFQSTASGHRDIRPSDKFVVARRRLRDTYTPSQPVTDRRVFAGRADVLTSIIRAIEDDRGHVVIYGHRGIGKTSMLHVLAQAAQDAQYHVIYISCGATFTFDEVIRVIAGAIPLRYHGDYGPTSPEAEAGSTFANLLPNVAINSRLAADLLSRIVGTRVLVCLDEFDRCQLAEFRRSTAELLKNLSDRSAPAQFVVAGVAQDLTELLDSVPSVQRNILALQMPSMSPSELEQLVRNGEPLTGLRFDEECIKLITMISRGLPHLASLLSHHAGLSAVDRGQWSVTPSDVASAITTATAQVGQRISKRALAKISDAAKTGSLSLLEAMAAASLSAGGDPFRAEDVARIAAKPLATCKTAAEEFADQGALLEIVEDDWGRGYRFLEEAIPLYVWLAAQRLSTGIDADARGRPDAKAVSQA